MGLIFDKTSKKQKLIRVLKAKLPKTTKKHFELTQKQSDNDRELMLQNSDVVEFFSSFIGQNRSRKNFQRHEV